MSTLLFLKNFSNYYNRLIKRFSDVDSYINNSNDYRFLSNINFNINDGITTTLTVNLKDADTFDYLLVCHDNCVIRTRWYILEAVWVRYDQYTLKLRRDVIAEYYNDIINAPAYMIKGMPSFKSPLIFNSENISVNQIKNKEILLTDESQKAWIVGYLSPNALETEDSTLYSSMKDSENFITLESFDFDFNDVNDPTKGAKLNVLKSAYLEAVASASMLQLTANISLISTAFENGKLNLKGERIPTPFAQEDYPVLSVFGKNVDEAFELLSDTWAKSFDSFENSIALALDTFFAGKNRKIVDVEERNDILNLNGPIYSSTNNKWYQISERNSYLLYERNYIYNAKFDDYAASIQAILQTVAKITYDKLKAKGVDVKYDSLLSYFALGYYIETIELNIVETTPPNDVLTVEMSKTHARTTDCAYDIFCLPFNDKNLNLATSIQRALTTKMYDIQILPFCPVRNAINNPKFGELGVNYSEIKINDVVVDYLYYVEKSQFKATIPFNISLDLTDIVEMKVANETEFVRLVSPNYNGSYQFTPAKNKGVSFINIACTYKPFNPFIYLSPNFQGLYGANFEDGRGLICQGNFSITQLNDAWVSYENSNKNYMNIFNTQIKTMDDINKLNVVSDSIASSLNAISTGVSTGMMTGSVTGGIASGVASFAGGVADIAIGQSIYQLNRQSQKDIYSYNLQNIKARPDTLVNVSAYNIINKYFPFVEFYSCTEEEKELVKNKIIYEGMSINAIGYIRDYLNYSGNNFIKASIIRLENVEIDTHVIDIISVELEKGVYITNG